MSPASFEARVKADRMTPASQQTLVASFRLCRLRARAPTERHGFASQAKLCPHQTTHQGSGGRLDEDDHEIQLGTARDFISVPTDF
jgi:hypothetical protein